MIKSAQLFSSAGHTLDQLLQSAVARGTVPAIVAIVANRETVLYRGAVGSATTTIHRIASMTKPLTSVCIMLLYEYGLLGLDDPVERYLPAFAGRPVLQTFNSADCSFTSRPAARPVTIRHLLAHTAGLGYDFCNETLLALCGDGRHSPYTLPLLHDPGQRWTYGHATAILGDIVAAVTGEPFHLFLETQLLQPLGMHDTGYFLKPSDQARLAPLYSQVNGIWVAEPPTFPLKPYPAGDGGLLSTAEDYVHFLQMLLNDGRFGDQQMITAASVSIMIRNQIGELTLEQQPAAKPAVTRPFPLGADRDKFGLGFQLKVDEEANRRSPGSYSWAGIFNTHFWADPGTGLAALLFTQLLPFCDEAFMHLFADFETCIYQNIE